MRNVIGIGEEAGEMELLRVPFGDLMSDVVQFGDNEFESYGRGKMKGNLPHLRRGIMAARHAAAFGIYHRSQMPVIDEEDIDALKSLLDDECIGYSFDATKVQDLRPTQCQIYCDRAIAAIAEFGVVKTKEYLGSKHIISDARNDILDGHHRWLTAMFFSPTFVLPRFKIDAPLSSILPMLLRFSDARHPRNN